MFQYFYAVVIVLICFTSSCVTKKKIIYIQNKNSPKASDYKDTSASQVYTVQSGDLLSIKIHGLNPTTSDFFNMDGGTNTGNSTDGAIYINSYSVSDSGKIYLPIIGGIAATGKTTDEIRASIQNLLKDHLHFSSVTVKIVNFNITVVGEVNKPGTYRVYEENFNIIEALALAGDLTDFSNRRKIKLVRESESPKKVYYIDLTDEKLLYSPLYHLRPHDILYVEPISLKSLDANLAPLRTVLLGASVLILILRLNRLF